MSNVPMTLPELMLAEHRTIFYHASTWAQLEDGRLIHIAAERMTVSEDGGITWSDITFPKDTNGDLIGGNGTSLVKLAGKEAIGLIATKESIGVTSKPGTDPWHQDGLLFWRSNDGGKTWQPPTPLTPPNFLKIGCHHHSAIRTSSGRLVLAIQMIFGQGRAANDPPPRMSGKLLNGHWVTTAGHFFGGAMMMCSACYSDDDGHTWQMQSSGELMVSMPIEKAQRWVSYTAEPTVTEVRPDTLLMFMRTGMGRIFQSWSYDNGETWTRPAPTVLAGQTTPASINTLPNGHLLCVWNQESADEVRRGFNRTRLSAAISRDGGRVWEFFQNIASVHETTRVEPGPIEAVHPEEVYLPAGQPALERDGAYIDNVEIHDRWSYPSVMVLKDRVIVAHTEIHCEQSPTHAQITAIHRQAGGYNQKQKVLPLTWFYGGKQPADNPFLKTAYKPAKP